MKRKTFDSLLVFALFGLAVGFFGMLYEGIVVLPRMLDAAPERLRFWRDFYAVIQPIIFYIPVVPAATVLLVGLYFTARTNRDELKAPLGWASAAQLATLLLTFYMMEKINLKACFASTTPDAQVIANKTLLMNVLSAVRLLCSFVALSLAFRAYTVLKQRPIAVA